MKEQLSTREAARIELARSSVGGEATLERAFAHALRLSAGALSVPRAGIWFAEDGFTRLRATMVFDAERDTFSTGEVIDLSACPRYAQALRSRRAVVADDARNDPRTSELRDYLERNGIVSMLDSPVFQRGEMVGVVCHEHVGSPRAFTKHDAGFGASVADMVGLYLEQDDLQRTYRELIEARRELEQARVMESLGRLAAGVAHDFNHVLGGISLTNELLQRRVAPAEKPLTVEIAGLVDQGARLVRQLVTFARRETPEADRTDLGEVLGAMEPTLRAMAGPDVVLEVVRPPEPLPIPLSRARLEQVVMNLVLNARDAMLGGGRVRVLADSDAAGVRLRVEDTGVGMDDEVVSRMFEPFFTTKPEGSGSGLGLATVYGIVLESRGVIEVDSAVGAGTRIGIRWPSP